MGKLKRKFRRYTVRRTRFGPCEASFGGYSGSRYFSVNRTGMGGSHWRVKMAQDMTGRGTGCAGVAKVLFFALVIGLWATASLAQETPQSPSEETTQEASPTREKSGSGDDASSGGAAEDEPVTPVPPASPEGPGPQEPEAGDEVRIEYKDGRALTGEFVVAGPESVTIRISNVDVRIPRGNIDSVTVLGSPVERYRRMRPSIADDDVERLINLARWLQSYRLFERALSEVKLALESDPTNDEAWRLQRELESQVEMMKVHRERARDEDAQDQKEERRERAEAQRENLLEKIRASHEIELLDEDEINLMRVYELNLNDPPRMRIERETVERFLTMYGDHPLVPTTREGRRAFLRKSPEAVLDIMFRVRARDLYGEVIVIDHPRSIELFRNRVQATWLVNNCATSRCHGGPDVGDLWLVNRKKRSDAATYTNLLILERSTLGDGTPLIDYERPENSPLLQLGLPPDDSAYPHPDVKGWRPAFRSRRARAFRQTIEWIEEMYRPRPDYPIEFVPPAYREEEDEEPEERFKPVER